MRTCFLITCQNLGLGGQITAAAIWLDVAKISRQECWVWLVQGAYLTLIFASITRFSQSQPHRLSSSKRLFQALLQKPIMSNDWSNGLCSCFGDISTCKLKLFLCFSAFARFALALSFYYVSLFLYLQVSSHGLCPATPSERMPSSSERTVSPTDSRYSCPF